MHDTLAFILQYGRPVLFGWVFADQAGVPVPVVPLLLGAGALAGGRGLSLPMSLALAVSASLLADLLWYAVGRRRGTRALGVLCRVTLEPDFCVRRAQDLFIRHGMRSLVIAKFLPAVNPLAAGLAGVVGIGLGRFVLYELGCAAVWAGTWIGLGYLLSDAIEEVAVLVARLGKGSIVLLAAVLIVYVGLKYANRFRFLRQLRIARIDPDELKRRLDVGEPVMIVDLRTSLDEKADPFTIRGAIRMAPEEIERRRSEFPRDAEIVLFCT